MAKRIKFFAAKADMISMLDKLAGKLPFEIKYVKDGSCEEPVIFYRAEDIPGLGRLNKSHCEKCFLIMKKDEPVSVDRQLRTPAVYQSFNPASLAFYPGGLSSDNFCLIHGQFAVMDDNEISTVLFKTVRSILGREFIGIRGWYIGREAREMYGKVSFACIGSNEPEDHHFRL